MKVEGYQRTEQLPKDLARVKAGVEGRLDVPAPPSPNDNEGSFEEDSPLPQTTYSQGEGLDVAAPELENTEQPQYLGETSASMPHATLDEDRIHEITEAIVNERWEELMSHLGNIPVWKERVNNEIIAIKQEILRVSGRFDNLQTAILGQVKEYDKSVKDIHSEMKALEKVLEKIMEPLVYNIKELNSIVEEMKGFKK